MLPSLIDSHCHIPHVSMPGGSDAVISSARSNGIVHMLCVAIDLETWPEVLDLARGYDCISASVGVHPNSDPDQVREPDPASLTELAADPEIVAIGETGLDYFRSKGQLDWQRHRFRAHIRAAIEIGKPLIIHCRDASEDVIRILTEERASEVGGVMHCFAEDQETADKALDLGFYISFSGIVTFKNARTLQQVAGQIPLDRLLIETDAPYLAPVPRRGKQNQPAYVRYVAEHIAGLRAIPVAELARATLKNYHKLFG